ncbi:MAG: rane protein [Pedosphaera sp.]|nr:rane protein [Pedosphaera sp.]
MESSNPLLSRNIDISRDREMTSSMNLEGVVNKTGILLLLCLAAGAFSWSQPQLQGLFIYGGLIGGTITFLIGMFKPSSTPFTAPLYAVFEGLCLGALSQLINVRFPGIMVNALLLTFGVLAVMLFLYVTRIIRVTSTLVKGVLMATAAVALVYVVDMIMGMFGTRVPYIHETGMIGVTISLVIVGIAAFNLLIDFAVIENNIRQRAPKYMEWYCGMALLVTIVWLYLELLRLLSKLRSR